MTFSTGEWIAIIGIILASMIGVIGLIISLKRNKSININQKSGGRSKGDQHQDINIDNSND